MARHTSGKKDGTTLEYQTINLPNILDEADYKTLPTSFSIHNDRKFMVRSRTSKTNSTRVGWARVIVMEIETGT